MYFAARKQHEEADRLIGAMYAGKVGWGVRERAQDLKLRAVFATVEADARKSAALARLVYGLPDAALLARIDPVLPSLGPQPGNTGLDALLHFARFEADWRREPEEWEPDSPNPAEQVYSLANHLFAWYPPPYFLAAAWLYGTDAMAETYRQWFVRLARGDKLESIRFPMPMTHRAAHFFLQAPSEFSIPAAMRFGQIRALGGSERLARLVAESFLNDLQTDEPFWFSVVTFLVNHPELSGAEAGPLLDYLRFRKFGTKGADAPEPRFSMKGRTVAALRKRLEEWHETLARLNVKGRRHWQNTGIEPLDRIVPDSLSGAECHWRIVEITDTLSLAEEGREMRHCVRSYQDGCVEGKTSIWSLRLSLSDNPAMRRLLTIEVNNARRAIVQVRGKCNQTVAAMHGNKRMRQAREVLKEWAFRERLGISCSL
ncbi:MAG: hypothetical protein OHK0029_27010 [Armatimonadaceae bacterium]